MWRGVKPMFNPYAYLFYVLVLVFSVSVPVRANEMPKILIAVTELNQNRDAEALLAGDFMRSGFEVILPGQLMPSDWVTKGDLTKANEGNIPMLRKAAAFSNAGLIFFGRIKMAFSIEELLNMKLDQAVATIDYRVLLTTSGKVIETDARTYREVGRSQQEVRYNALKKMMADIEQRVISRIAENVTVRDERDLENFKRSFNKKIASKRPSSHPPKSAPPDHGGPVKDLEPPKITLFKPVLNGRDLVLTSKNKQVVEGQVEDESPLEFFRINNKDVALDANGYFSTSVTLAPEDRRLVLEALDQACNLTRKELMISKKSDGGATEFELSPSRRKPTLWGLSVGVSKYAGTAFDLKYADLDAQSLAEFLVDQEGRLFREVHFRTLLNRDVTRDSVLKAISTHLGKAAPEDVAFIFLAGHGIKHPQTDSYYFMPYDADLNTVLSKGLRMSDFEEAINILSKNVSKLIVVLDTCHAGAMKVAGQRDLGGGEDLSQALKAASGRFILASSKSGETSFENEKFKLHEQDSGHGVFTYALLKGMSGDSDYDQNSYITLQELSGYVAKEVPRLTDGRQHPYFMSSGTDMPFILLGQ